MPSLIQQKTLKGPMEFVGTALHTGLETSVRISPSEPDTGYRFRRADLPGAVEVEASVANIKDTLLATSLGLNGASVQTVEHLLSALAGSGVDNASIEVMGDEIPILDGSAAPFVRGIEKVGLYEQSMPKRMLRIKESIGAEKGDSTAILKPSDAFSIHFIIEFENLVIGRQELDFHYSPDAYRKDIAFARTFGFMKDAEYLMAKGLALGGSLENAVVVGDDRVINPEGLRSPDEFVRHKILDTIGDLSLLGIPILGAYSGFKAGHGVNRLLMLEVMNQPAKWDLVCMEETEIDGINLYPARDTDLPSMVTSP